MNTLISSTGNGWLCDALEARLQSADAARERGRLVESVLARVPASERDIVRYVRSLIP